ncbi:glycosyltransferase [Mucilaginibacter sp. KACC 22063]|uniref:glycosyltransferase n=1 Tax=Mucilaginibacter sp. KACC 22063 TaxID=3025666 RepID=UPI0023672CE0|nr:glycosyltransferase [Mucilaginibacter sp. KACC 22063]WDF53682.1 glycosyltransferase [Mucilaginibacter sp. KACC 22063]
MVQHLFPEVTLLITHYNRSRSLQRLLKTFADQGFVFGGIVVSDDGSKPEHLEYIKNLKTNFEFDLITTPVNKGLGNNINKGQDAVKTPLTLYVQEDFEPKPAFAEHFKDALTFFKEDPTWDIARFYAYFSYPYKKPYKNGFSEMLFKSSIFYGNHLKFYVYSDHPHLRRSNFLEKFGRYPEGIKGDRTEFLMAASFIKHKGRGLFYDNFNDLFYQKNSSDEPSTMNRADWRESKNPVALTARYFYLRFKLLRWTYEVLYKK